MRRTAIPVLPVVLVGAVGFGGDLPGWSTDGTTSYSSAVVIQNVSDVAAVVNVAYPTPSNPASPEYQTTVSPGASQTLYVNDAATGPWNGAAVVSSDVPVVASQTFLWTDSSGATQWASHSGAHRHMSFGFGGPSTQWCLPVTPHAPSRSGFGSNEDAEAPGDRDGDGVPDDEDYCPDVPGSKAVNGC